MGGGSFSGSGVLGGIPQQDPPVAQPHATLPQENENADWEEYWLVKIDERVHALQQECQAEIHHIDDVVNGLDERIQGEQVVLYEIQQKMNEEKSIVDAQFEIGRAHV